MTTFEQGQPPLRMTSKSRATGGSDARSTERVEGFRAPGDPANTAELLKFLLDRTGYIKLLEQEDTPESLARIENLRELVNAAMDSRDRGETLSEFLDHAALVSDADQYDENARITLMTLHAAKGLEFPLVFLIGLEEGSVPALAHAAGARRYRRGAPAVLCRHDARDGHAHPLASALSPALRHRYAGGQRAVALPRRSSAGAACRTSAHRSSARQSHPAAITAPAVITPTKMKISGRSTGAATRRSATSYSGPTYNSIDNIAEFFASRGKKFTRPKLRFLPRTDASDFSPDSA